MANVSFRPPSTTIELNGFISSYDALFGLEQQSLSSETNFYLFCGALYFLWRAWSNKRASCHISRLSNSPIFVPLQFNAPTPEIYGYILNRSIHNEKGSGAGTQGRSAATGTGLSDGSSESTTMYAPHSSKTSPEHIAEIQN